MDIKVSKIKQYNSTYKYVLLVDGNPVCITRSGNRMSECVQYLNGYNADINDGTVRKVLDKYRLPSVNKETKKRGEKHKAVHKFSENINKSCILLKDWMFILSHLRYHMKKL